MHEVQARGFIGESFLDKVLWNLWNLRQFNPLGYVEAVLDLATVDTPDKIKEKMGINLDETIEAVKKELKYFEDKRQSHNPLMRKSAEAVDEVTVQMAAARKIEHALVNAYFDAGFLFRREEFRQRSG
jgi:hypothetical protein